MIELTKTEKELIKKYGQCIKAASFVKEQQTKMYSIGPRLDRALNGGVPTRCLAIVSGPKKVGKTTTILQLAKSFLDDNRKVVYGDFEYRWKKMNAEGVKDLDADRITFVRSEEREENKESIILTAEDKLLILATMMKSPEFYGSLFIIDSLSALCPKDVMESDEISGSRRSTTPKLITDFIKQIAPYIQINNLTVVCIVHLIANTSGYGSPFKEDSGNYVQYQCDVHLRTTKNPVKIKDGDKDIGQSIVWDIITSANGSPQEKVESFIRFGYGIDDITELIEDGVDCGVVSKGGAWYEYDGIRGQGKEKFRTALLENPLKIEKLKLNLKEIYEV